MEFITIPNSETIMLLEQATVQVHIVERVLLSICQYSVCKMEFPKKFNKLPIMYYNM